MNRRTMYVAAGGLLIGVACGLPACADPPPAEPRVVSNEPSVEDANVTSPRLPMADARTVFDPEDARPMDAEVVARDARDAADDSADAVWVDMGDPVSPDATTPDAGCDPRTDPCEVPPDPCVGVECDGAPGAPCTSDEDCAGDEHDCITEVDELGPTGFVDGYCLLLNCGRATACPAGSACFQIGDDGQSACLPTCAVDSDCRAGYICDPAGYCVPENACAPVPESCNGFDDDCDGRADDGNGLCPGGAVCREGVCDACGGIDFEGECRRDTATWCDNGELLSAECAPAGLACRVVPGIGATCVGRVGAPCLNESQCVAGDVCIPEVDASGPTGLPGGLCIRFDCVNDADCDPGSGCFVIDDAGATACLATCADDGDCRRGYLCYEPGVCLVPESPAECTPERCNELDDDCDGQVDEDACGVIGCADGNACPDGRCIADLPGGWCELGCQQPADCPVNSTCVRFDNGETACLDVCDAQSPCPAGWTCLPQGVCWLDCRTLGCAPDEVCAPTGLCERAPEDVRIDVSVLGVEIFPVNRLENFEPWDGPGGAILDLFLGLAQDLAQEYLELRFCKIDASEVPFVGNALGDACRDIIDRLLDVARELVDSLIGGLFAGIEPPDARGTASLSADGAETRRALAEVSDSYSPNWNGIDFDRVSPTADLSLTVYLIDVDAFFDDALGTVTLGIADLEAAFGEGQAVPVSTFDRGNGNIVVVNVRVELSL